MARLYSYSKKEVLLLFFLLFAYFIIKYGSLINYRIIHVVFIFLLFFHFQIEKLLNRLKININNNYIKLQSLRQKKIVMPSIMLCLYSTAFYVGWKKIGSAFKINEGVTLFFIYMMITYSLRLKETEKAKITIYIVILIFIAYIAGFSKTVDFLTISLYLILISLVVQKYKLIFWKS